MIHLILCREYPPAPYPAGGIGTYVSHIARLLAEAGETVHLIAQRWDGAPKATMELYGGKLIVHRISLVEPVAKKFSPNDAKLLSQLGDSDCPTQVFSWQAAQIAERLIESEGIDVIEAQEWEAPLYYLQLRRALGLGPRREPPCLIHLHSPSRMIFRHNDWDETLTDFLPLCRIEEYSIRAADAWVCPSRFLADEASRSFSLERSDVEVIPYPVGDVPHIERAPGVWSRDAICYAGRLELRKGVLEWVAAAVEIAASHAAVTFDFIGSDGSLDGSARGSVEAYLKARIPRNLRSRFRFRGALPRKDVLRALAEFPVVAVPSRWDNLPFSCIEAMATGLPVLTSPHGGMVELVSDLQSGWIASDGTAPGLAAALKGVLATPAEERATMGRRAAASVRRICANDAVLERHLEMRARLARRAPRGSRRVPSSVRRADSRGGRHGFGVVVVCLARPELLPGCLATVRDQTVPPAATVVVTHERFRNQTEVSKGLRVLFTKETAPEAARSLGSRALLAAAPRLLAVAVLSESVRLAPHYVASCQTVFDRQPGVALVSCWVQHEGAGAGLDSFPCPVSGSGFTSRDFVKHAAILIGVPPGALLSNSGLDFEALAGDLVDRGWAAVTYPDTLMSSVRSEPGTEAEKPARRYSVLALAQSRSPLFALKWFLHAPWRDKTRWILREVKQPARIFRLILWQFRQAAIRR